MLKNILIMFGFMLLILFNGIVFIVLVALFLPGMPAWMGGGIAGLITGLSYIHFERKYLPQIF